MSKNNGSSIIDIVVFSFADTQTAGNVVKELKASQKLAGYKVRAEAVVIREPDGSIKVHEPGRGGRDAAIGAAIGGTIGLLAGPVGVLWLAAAGGALGGVAGHFAGRAIPKSDLELIGARLEPNSSAFMVLIEDTDAEAMVDSMEGYKADVVIVTLGDELSGTIVQTAGGEIQMPEQPKEEAVTPKAEQPKEEVVIPHGGQPEEEAVAPKTEQPATQTIHPEGQPTTQTTMPGGETTTQTTLPRE